MSLAAGDSLGQYRILDKLGEGGMGEVYRARDTELNRDVALKVLPDALGTDPERTARFRREAQLLASLNHPNIAQIYGAGIGTVPFLAMELVPGATLAEILERDGALAPDEVTQIARQIADALETAHEAGIIHRDLKPANIKRRDDGVVKVLDFGLARALDSGASDAVDAMSSPTMLSPAATQRGVILGTAGYMSPEQAKGRQVDKRADIWAFGVILFELLTGTRLFRGETVTEVIASVIKETPSLAALPAATPPALRQLIARCLERDPKARLRDIGEARIMLDRGGDAAAAFAPAAPAVAARRSRWPRVAAAVGVLAAGVLIGVLWRGSRDTPAVEWFGTRIGGATRSLTPRLSPDGHLLAFIALLDGQSQIAVMKPSAGSWTVLTRDRTQGLTYSLAWSPDGDQIYYDRSTDVPQGIYMVPALGGDERLVVENAGNPIALRDGSLIFLRRNAERIAQLHRLRPDTSKIEPLPMALDDRIAFGVTSPFRAIDATRIVVNGYPITEGPSAAGLYVFDLASGTARRIAQDLVGDPFDVAVDAASGSVLVTVRDGSSYRIVRLSPDAFTRSTTLLTLLDRPDVDADGNGSLFMSIAIRQTEVLRFSPTGGQIEAVTTGPIMASGGTIELPDGRVLLQARTGSGNRVLVAAPRREPVAFVQTDEPTLAPITLVGKELVALRLGTGASDIALVSADTGRIVRRIKAPGEVVSLDASPGGETLYVAAGGNIHAIPADGGPPRTIAPGNSFAVDHDSGDLIVKLDEKTGARLTRIPSSGGQGRPITLSGDLRLTPLPLTSSSIRNGRLLLSASSRDSWYWYVASVDLSTGRIDKVPVDYFTDFHYASWAHDGRVLGTGVGLQAALWKFEKR